MTLEKKQSNSMLQQFTNMKDTLGRLRRTNWTVWFSFILLLFVMIQLCLFYLFIEFYFTKHHPESKHIHKAPHSINHLGIKNKNKNPMNEAFSRLKDLPNFQNMQNIQNLQNLQNMENFQNVQNFQNFQKMGDIDLQHLNNKNNNKINELEIEIEIDWSNDFETTNFSGGIPYTSYLSVEDGLSWGTSLSSQKRYPGRIACLVLSLYPRNKILMKTIGDTYAKHCDQLFWILDDSNNIFNTSMHIEAIKRGRTKNNEKFGGIDNDDQVISDCDIDKKQTEIKHLDELYNGKIILLNLTRAQHPNKRNTWEKVHRLYAYLYIKYLNEFDWFVRLDDDVMVNMYNLRYFLSFYNFNFSLNTYYYIGHTLMDRWKKDNIIYNAGNLHVINSNTLRKMGPYLLTLPSMGARDAHAHCADFEGGNDDPHFGQCLNFLGIYPINTLDYYYRNRFGIFRWNDHKNIHRPKKDEEISYYWKCRSNLMKSGKECCFGILMNDHPWIHITNHPHFRYEFIDISKKYNDENKFNNLLNQLKNDKYEKKSLIPTKPRSFIYTIDFELKNDGKTFQIKEPPHGQRISRKTQGIEDSGIDNDDDSKNKGYECHKCSIGNKNDIYWTNEWDRTLLVNKINEKNKEKFYAIQKYFPNQLISTQYDIDKNTLEYIDNGDPYIQKLNRLVKQALDPNVELKDLNFE